MKQFILIFCILLFTVVMQAQSVYKQVRIVISNPKVDYPVLAQYDVDLEHAVREKDGSIIVVLPQESFERLQLLNFSMSVMIDDCQKHYQSLPKLTPAEENAFKQQSKELYGVTGFGYGSKGGYYTVAEINAQLDTMVMLYPNLITPKFSIGNTVENRPIYAVKISDNPNTNEAEPEVLFTAMHHAREPQGMMAVIYYMYYLLENYNTNPSVKYLVDNRQIYFIPCVNPDGYENNAAGGMWRKNRKNNGDGTFGIDLNRNYGPEAYWNANNGGSSTTPSSDTYRGPTPFSEPETQALKNFVAGKNIKTNLNYHTYSNLLIYPYGALSRETDDSLMYREFGAEMTRFNGYQLGTDIQTVGYSTRGNSDDFMYDGDLTTRGKILAMTPEVGTSTDGFWPAQNRIFPLAQENLFPNLFYTWVAGEYCSLQSYTFNRQYFNPGDQVSMNVSIKNKGIGKGKNIGVVLEAIGNNVVVNTGTALLDSISARSVRSVPTPFIFTIAANAPGNQPVRLLVKTFSGTSLMSTDTVKLLLGVPTYALLDTTNNPATLWNITASPATPAWEATTATFQSSPNSYTDSKTGTYAASATVTLTSKNPINLNGLNSPILSFWTKFDIESRYDCGVIKISTNGGSTWNYLSGSLSKPASGVGKQTPAGAFPVYDAIVANWTKEDISLAAYAGQQITLRFELLSDGSIQKDGWYIDDIGIVTYQVIPVELTSFTATANNGKVTIRWSTATETNNRGFELQRSTAPGKWEVLSFIEGRGTSTKPVEYVYEDNSRLSGKVSYRLKQIDFDGSSVMIAPVEADLGIPVEFALDMNYPNPFNPSTTISFSLPEAGLAVLSVYDVSGKLVQTLVNSKMEAGKHSVVFDAHNLASGMYFAELRSGAQVQRIKMSLLK